MTNVLVVSSIVAVALLFVVAEVIVIHMRRKLSSTDHSKILQQGSLRKERHIST